jgi:hypothetical protein
MDLPGYKRLSMALGVFSLGLLILAGCLFEKYARLTIEVALAHEQVKVFDEMRTRALQSEPA